MIKRREAATRKPESFAGEKKEEEAKEKKIQPLMGNALFNLSTWGKGEGQHSPPLGVSMCVLDVAKRGYADARVR